MKNLLLIICLISCYSFIRCQERKEKDSEICGYHSYLDSDEFCVNNKTGYEGWLCDDIDPWNDYNVWVKQKSVTCEKGYECRCWEDDDWAEMSCECYNPRTAPSFPPTGVIRWDGTFYYDDNWWEGRNNPRTVYTPGEIHKDRNGRFLYKWTEIGSWPDGNVSANTTVHFKILIPHNETFLEYTGVENGKKECSKKVVEYGSDLNVLWPKIYRQGKTFALYDSKTKEGRKKISIDTWSLINHFEDGMDEITWTVRYNSERDHAIPVKYYYRTEDGFNGELRVAKKKYKYERLKKDDESFQLKDYCNE